MNQEYKSVVVQLKSEIAGLVAEQKSLRKNNPVWTNALNNQKMCNRSAIRSRHLLVAYLQGVPYRTVERHTHDIILYYYIGLRCLLCRLTGDSTVETWKALDASIKEWMLTP